MEFKNTEFKTLINSRFDNIYVLNLEKSSDRREHINSEFKRVGIEKYEFFKATPHDSPEVYELINNGLVKSFPSCFRCNRNRCSCENNYLTPFQLGNWCSFLNIFRDIIKNDYEFVLICEDDIVFSFQYERIINKLLSEKSFKSHNIDMKKPLLIRLGTAFNPNNHNSSAPAVFLKNYSLCNPCFAINKEMAIVYLKALKIIDYHSDVYFHQKIPKNIKGIQYFTMYPYPVYELSFVKSLQKFNSEVRPKNALRRKEYKEFLFLTTNNLLNIFLKQFLNIINKYSPYSIGYNIMGFNGVFNNDFLDELITINENYGCQKYYFDCIIIINDFINSNENNDINSNENNDINSNEKNIQYIQNITDTKVNNEKVLIKDYSNILNLPNNIKKIIINVLNDNDITFLKKILKLKTNQNKNIQNIIEKYKYFKNFHLENTNIEKI
jgi:GR25 family glycosyltransferase involved in LPS biosynthesis